MVVFPAVKRSAVGILYGFYTIAISYGEVLPKGRFRGVASLPHNGVDGTHSRQGVKCGTHIPRSIVGGWQIVKNKFARWQTFLPRPCQHIRAGAPVGGQVLAGCRREKSSDFPDGPAGGAGKSSDFRRGGGRSRRTSPPGGASHPLKRDCFMTQKRLDTKNSKRNFKKFQYRGRAHDTEIFAWVSESQRF